MELLRQFKEDGYFTASLYSLLTQRQKDDKEKITPSIYIKEMKMSTAERLKNLNFIEVNNLISKGDKHRIPVLAFTPRIIVFQNYKPNDRIVAKFSVKNISNDPTFLNMVFKESSNFFIKPCGAELLSRLAPGISVTFAITFIPVQFQDYVHRVTFYTDVDQYVLALIGMGPRPIFDFPDEIVLPETPLKVESFTQFSVHNICTIPAGFTVSTKCPFSIQPKFAYLHPNQKVELKIGFKTMHLGESVGILEAMYETDEIFHIKLRGTTHTANIELEKSVVRFLDTYNGMARQQTLKLTNKSDEVITYICMKNDCVYKDFGDKIKLATMFYDMKDSESAKYRKLVQYDVLSSDEHERVYTRIFYDEIQALVADESLLFQNLHFNITPIKGKLWPNKITELTVTFSPKEIGDFDAVAYLDIDGIFDRVPLTVQGTSLPPFIHLNVETLNMDTVYINTKYHYEIVAINKGHINGVIVYKEVQPLFGSVITCHPEMHCLRPGEKEIFTISFINSNQGPYFEELNFQIRDTDVVRKLYLKGEVIYPTLKFSIPCLDFGNISVGVPKTLPVDVINESVVKVNASVKISSDGPEVSSITLEDCEASQCARFELPSYPKEFHIDPSNIELNPNSRFMLKVTLTANLIRDVKTNMEIELEKSDSPPIVLPITYYARVPEITPAPEINLRACFLDCIYHYDVIISSNEFWGYFSIADQDVEETLKVNMSIKRGLIRPNTTISLPMTVTTGVLGLQEHTIRIYLFGMPDPIEICRVTGNGVRPIVTCMPMAIHWGQVRLLTKSQKTLTLCNDSPVTVHYKASLLNRDGRWQILPPEGHIEPESETELYLFLFLVDADSYTNKAVIQLEKVKDILVPLTATGVGTSIIVGDERDHVNLGRHFVKLPIETTVTMENCGTRLHSLEWSEHIKAPKTKTSTPLFFNLEPRVLKLGSGEKIDLKITGLSTKVLTVREKWYLIGSVEGINKKELLLECIIIAEFVEPRVDTPVVTIELRYDYGPYNEFYKLTDIMTIQNVSKLPLDLDIAIKPPFAFIQKNGTYKIDPEERHLCCCISYNEGDLDMANLINAVGTHESKAFIDCLTLKPVEPFRKDSLNFFEDINKIKMAFHLTHNIEERLEDQEAIKLQIIFDTTKHLSLKSKVYYDTMRLKFKGHKNKDSIKVHGKINFPNVLIMNPKLDFQCVLNGTYESKTIKIQNPTPLIVCYKFRWKRCNIISLPGHITLPEITYDVSQLRKNQSVSEAKSASHYSAAEEMMTIIPEVSEHEDGKSLEDVPDISFQKSSLKNDTDKSLNIFDDDDLPDIVLNETQNKKQKILQKITPMLHMYHDPEFPWASKFSKNFARPNKIYVNDLFQLTPHRGMLKPDSIQHIHVMFRPKRNISVRAVLELEVLGGPSEYLTVTGQSSDLMFNLNTQTLNFKIRSFHKEVSEHLIISNISQLPFEYKTYLNQPDFENDIHATISGLVPPEKTLEPEETAEIKVMVRPGVLGYFHRVFVLEIGHNPHIPIEVFGWGVIPQVYIGLPRPGLAKQNNELGYYAIATLSIDYLAAVSEIFTKGTTEHLNSPQVEKCFEDPDFRYDWHVCSGWDGYPSNMDIELAIERMQVEKHIKHRPDILTLFSTTNKVLPIPNFHTTSYLLDYGVVITGNTVSCVIDVINYGPIPVKLIFTRNTLIKSWLRVKLCGKLNPGEIGKMEITFSPTSTDFTELEQNVETTFNLEVPFGVTIPVQINALCAVPYLKSNINILDFGDVRCGDKIVCTVPLRNVGKPTCVWYVTLKVKTSGPNALTILDTSGKYEPGEGGLLSVSFKPTMDMMYEGILIFRFHMNPNKMVIPVIGHGVFPHTHVIGPKVNFPPTLPWAETTEIYFGLTNPCPFPIEMIITHIDEKWKEEDEIFQLLCRYYNKPEEMLVPAIKPGAGMPLEIQVFYDNFKSGVKKALEDITATKATSSARTALPSKKIKTPKVAPKSGGKEKDIVSPKSYRSEAEIVSDMIKTMKEEEMDPIADSLREMDDHTKQIVTEKLTKGLMLFLHGSPCEENICKELAYSMGMHLDLPTVNFDLCVVEALCVSDCLAKTVMLSAVNDLWDNAWKNTTKESSVGSEEVEGAFGETEDEFEIIRKKLDFLLTHKNIATPRSKTSEKKKSGMGVSCTAVVANAVSFFQEDLLQELLTDFFTQDKFQRGFVMDSLTSTLLKSPPMVLNAVLKAKSSIWNIHLILCHSDFTKWLLNFEENQREAELIEEQITKVVVYDEAEIKKIITIFEEMDEDEYDNANPELKSLYIQHGLEQRRQKYFEKHGIKPESNTGGKKDRDKSFKDTSAVFPAGATESKKKIRRDDKGKVTTEIFNMQAKYNDYTRNVFDTLINMANNWIVSECEIGYPLYSLNGQILGVTQKKIKRKSEIQLMVSEINLAERGFPLTLLVCPCKQYEEALVDMFANDPFIQQILKIDDVVDVLKSSVDRKEYTVLLQKTLPVINDEESLKWYYLDEAPIKKCECNQITDLNLLDDTTQDNVMSILSKWNCTCGKKVTSSQTSTTEIPSMSYDKNVSIEEEDEYFYPLPLNKTEAIPVHGRRLILEPGDLVRCKYAFSPKLEGNFSIKRYIEVAGWPESRVDITVTGICDLPRLDNRPKKMFDNFVRRTLEDQVYKITYLDDQKQFEFGPIFIGKNRIYEEEYSVDLKNASLLRADVDIEFLEVNEVFELDKNFISLEPGCRGKLTITAAPAVVGVHTVLLLFCIKDNPEIVKITIACSGVIPNVQVLPITKHIDYGKLLLYRREDDRFIIKNDSILPILWRVRNPQDFVEDFIMTKTSGIIPRNENQVVPVTFIACSVRIISQLPLIIDIFDELGRGDPLIVDTLYMSGECYDVMIECAYENPNESFLNYGNVKVNSTIYREMYLLNRGKYNIYYKLKRVKKFPEPGLLKSFEVVPECGIVPANLKLIAIEFACTPTTSMNINNVPAYTCSLLDGSKDQVVVAKFPICVTIASFYNTFTLFPLGELNFHIIPVGSGVLREVILNNTSKCPFNYEIIVPDEYNVDPDDPANMPKGDKIKFKTPPIKCGNFLIVNEDNLLAPGTSRTIQIQFLATGPRRFEETIHFIVSDTCPAEAQGVPLKLVGVGAIPVLDFWNLENTFREHLIVRSMAEYKVPQSSPHCVFVEETVTLHFFCVTVNTCHCAAIDLYNNGLVPCVLGMKMHYQANTNDKIFYLEKYEKQIDGLMHKRLEIFFSPKAIEEYRAVLEIRLKLLHDQEQSYKLCLIGDGIIPRIRLISPPLRQHRLAVIQFPVTCLGSITNKVIRIKNISSIKSLIFINILQAPNERPLFWIDTTSTHDYVENEQDMDTKGKTNLNLNLTPEEVANIQIFFSPLTKGRTNCDVKINIVDNPYEHYTVLCEAEAFIEDVVLVGLEMLSMEIDLETVKGDGGTVSNTSTGDIRKKIKSAPTEKRKSKGFLKKLHADSKADSQESSVLKYVLDFGGCELCVNQKRSVVMLNNSEKVYRYLWDDAENIVIKPSVGYISPGEEKDLEITFFSAQPINLKREVMFCKLTAISDDSLIIDSKGTTWDNRQLLTLFNHNADLCLNERYEKVVDEQHIPHTDVLGSLNIVILYSVNTEYIRYTSDLKEETIMKDTFIYQKRSFKFNVENVGSIAMKLSWYFTIDDEYPKRIDRADRNKQLTAPTSESPKEDESVTGPNRIDDRSLMPDNREGSIVTLFSESTGRDSADTWFEMDLPFSIVPNRECLKPRESKTFEVTFSPLEAFDFKVRLKSSIDNLDPYDQNMMCKISAKSLIPYVHLDIEENDYITTRRKACGVVLPPHMLVLEFNVLGWGCYKKSFRVINPTCEGYEFVIELNMPEKTTKDKQKKEFIPVHCNLMKGYVEGGTSTDVTFTFAPTAPGSCISSIPVGLRSAGVMESESDSKVYESQWRFMISKYSVNIPLMVVGIVREPDVVFVPTILVIKNSLVGFTTTNVVKLKNNENEALTFDYKGNSLCNESGVTLIKLEPEQGVLKPQSEVPVTIYYTPMNDGPRSFKIFCQVSFMMKYLTLCINALSHLVKPTVTYYIIGNDHLLNHEVITNIHLEQTASKYERTVPFKIKNDGSATFFFEWNYTCTPVKKYLTVSVEPRTGYLAPAAEVECILHFHLKQVPVEAYPVSLSISDGPEYSICLYAEIEKPLYHFSCREIDFGKCIVNAPDRTYKKNLAFTNDDKVPLILDLATENVPDLYVDYQVDTTVDPKQRTKLPVYFRPKSVKEFEFKLQFWVNSLCEEIITIRGEGVPLLVDLYEGCQKSFDLGPVKVGREIIREIEVMNHSKVPINCAFTFQEVYETEDETASQGTSICLDPNTPGQAIGDAGPSRVKSVKVYRDEKMNERVEMDIQNSLASMKVVPANCIIQPLRKRTIKIQFKPMTLISSLHVQLNLIVLEMIKPLVLLSGSATGMFLEFSQNSLQFGRVRKRGCRVLKVMLHNKGDFGTKFWWQPLVSEEFSIKPMKGSIAAHTNVTFTVTFKPHNYNQFVKVWASCNVAHYRSLELALYGACVDAGALQNQTVYLECPVRSQKTEYVIVTNPTDETWFVLSEMEGASCFTTLREFHVEANSSFEIPIHFKPKSTGKFEGQILFTPLGESALFVTLIGAAIHPEPNGVINITVSAKQYHTEPLLVHNISENPESYIVGTELVQTVPDKFDGYYEIKYPETVKTWGEAAATCRWTIICFEPCEMMLKVMFVNETTREYQYYEINATVIPSEILGTLKFVCRARESVQQELKVANPLNEDNEFHVHCDKLACSEVVRIGRQSERKIILTYSPLVVGEFEDFLTIENYLVGTRLYSVMAKCLPAKEKPVEFKTPFGTCIPIRLRVQNKSENYAQFTVTVDHSSILADREYALQPSEKGKFLVWFEPTELGVQMIRLSFASSVAGEFVFKIKGTATEPKPQGPYEVRAGGVTAIRFKNVFTDTRTFRFLIDREEFYVKSSMESIKGKRETRVNVYLSERPARGWAEPPTGCLTIESWDSVEPKVQWTYFLQGIP